MEERKKWSEVGAKARLLWVLWYEPQMLISNTLCLGDACLE